MWGRIFGKRKKKTPLPQPSRSQVQPAPLERARGQGLAAVPFDLIAQQQAFSDAHKYLQKLDLVGNTLKDILASVRSHNVGVNSSKVAGGVASVVGGALLVAAMFTGGATLIPAVLCGVGGITSAGASLGDYLRNDEFKASLHNAQNDIIKAKEKFGMSLLFAAKATAYQRDVELATIGKMTVTTLSTFCDIGVATFGTSSTAAKTLVADTGIGVITVRSGWRGVAGIGATFETTAATAIGATFETTAGTIAGHTGNKAVTVGGLSTGAKIFGTAGGVLGVVAGGFDIYTGINGFVDGHPTEEDLDELLVCVALEKKTVMLDKGSLGEKIQKTLQ